MIKPSLIKALVNGIIEEHASSNGVSMQLSKLQMERKVLSMQLRPKSEVIMGVGQSRE